MKIKKIMVALLLIVCICSPLFLTSAEAFRGGGGFREGGEMERPREEGEGFGGDEIERPRDEGVNTYRDRVSDHAYSDNPVAEGPRGGVYAEGPRGSVYAEGPMGSTVAKGPGGNVYVNPSAAARLASLPEDADAIYVAGQPYYVLGDAYYQPCPDTDDGSYCIVQAPQQGDAIV